MACNVLATSCRNLKYHSSTHNVFFSYICQLILLRNIEAREQQYPGIDEGIAEIANSHKISIV